MNKQTVLDNMGKQGIVAVLRSESVEQAMRVAHSCKAGGVHIIEITFSVPDAAQAIQALVADADLIVGAGTVLTVEQAQLAVKAGAAFLVAPTFNREIATFAAKEGIAYIPGCMTVTEMQNASEAGCSAVKLFPASEYSYGFIRAVKAPLPHLNIMPTGGVSLANAADWIAAGAFCIGVGGNLTKVVSGNYEAITQAAKDYCVCIEQARKA